MSVHPYPLNGTPGTTATAANTGASIFSMNSLTATLASGAAAQGPTGLRVVGNGSATGVAVWLLDAASTTPAFSVWWRVPNTGAPASAQTWWSVYDNASPAARVADLISYRSDGTVRVVDKGNTLTTLLSAAQVSANAGVYLRFEVVMNITAGSFTMRAYNAQGTQVGSTATVSSGANLGTAPALKLYSWTPNTFTGNNDVDSVQTANDRTTEIGPIAANTTPPTFDAGADQVANVGDLVTLQGSATSSTGTVATNGYAWTFNDWPGAALGVARPTLSNSTTATPSFTVNGGRYILTGTASDTDGNVSTSDFVEIDVPTDTITVVDIVANNGWTASVAAVADQNESPITYAESGATGAGTSVTFRLAPLTTRSSGFSLNINALVQAIGGTQRVELIEGTTVRKTWTISPGTSFADLPPLTMTASEMSTVGSWLRLNLRITNV